MLTYENSSPGEQVIDVSTGLTPGVYRVSELVDRLGVSRATVERYITRFSLPVQEITHCNKPARGVVLDEVTCAQVSQASLSSRSYQTPTSTDPMDKPEDRHLSGPPSDSLDLTAAMATIERLEAELRRADEQIQTLKDLASAKDGEISAHKTALMLASRTMEALPPAPLGASAASPWWKRILRLE